METQNLNFILIESEATHCAVLEQRQTEEEAVSYGG